MDTSDSGDRQLGLGFSDDNQPAKIDAMLHALEAWAAVPTNARKLLGLPQGFHAFWEGIQPELEPAALERLSETDRRQVIQRFRDRFFQPSQRAVEGNWPDMPEPDWELTGTTWQPPVHDTRDAWRPRLVGHCDLVAEYRYGRILERCTTRTFRPVKHLYGAVPVWEFELAAEGEPRWIQIPAALSVFFLVRPHIATTADLLKQLQRIAAVVAPQHVRDRPPQNREKWLAVFAPPHDQAAEVCRRHGFPYLEFRG